MKVFIVMGQVWPEAVYTTYAAAKTHIIEHRRKYPDTPTFGRTDWNIYERELQGNLPERGLTVLSSAGSSQPQLTK